MTRPILATIHSQALQHNLAVARSQAGSARVVAVIKANAYGHGLMRAARAFADADAFAVLSIDEAVALRHAGFQQRIVLLEGVFSDSELALCLQYHLTPVVHAAWQLALLEHVSASKRLDIFLKINTGMNRLGFAPAAFDHAYRQLRQHPAIGEIVVATHFATADEPEGVEAQVRLFRQVVGDIDAPCSLANSAALMRFPHTLADWVRPGIMLYGASPFPDRTAQSLGLRAAMTLSSEIIAIQHLEAGEAVGYGRCFVAERPARIGIVACGYADGYPRHAPNGTPIEVAGKLTGTVGRVSMDMLYADITAIPEADIGSPVELWGRQVPVDAVAQASGTVGYELLCALAPRVPVTED